MTKTREGAHRSRTNQKRRVRHLGPSGHALTERTELPGTEHVTPVDGNVFADIGFPPEQAENLVVHSQLTVDVEDVIRGMTRHKAAKLLGVSTSAISALRRDRAEAFTIDELISMLGHAGMSVRVATKKNPYFGR